MLIRHSRTVAKWTARESARCRISTSQQRLNLGFGRHRGRALQSGGHDGTGRIGALQHLVQWPTGQQSVTQRAAERVTRAKAVQGSDRYRGRLDPLALGLGQHPLGALFHDRQLDTRGEQSVGGLLRLSLANGDLALLAIANRNRDLWQSLLHLLGGMPGVSQNIGR